MKTLSQIQQQQLRIGAAMHRAQRAGHRDLLNQLGNWASELAEQESDLLWAGVDPIPNDFDTSFLEISEIRTPGRVYEHAVALD